ncbi:MAG: capsular biosynthesis protein, partial [Anaerolineae bacterium]|nr:capsular biosynthesis protein [Anaerolineae bacterium]
RAPLLAEGCRAAERWVGAEEARKLVLDRPKGILDNLDPVKLRLPAAKVPVVKSGYGFSFWKRWLRRAS